MDAAGQRSADDDVDGHAIHLSKSDSDRGRGQLCLELGRARRKACRVARFVAPEGDFRLTLVLRPEEVAGREVYHKSRRVEKHSRLFPLELARLGVLRDKTRING